MPVSETLLNIIKPRMFCPCPIAAENNLYTDLGFDSLSFTGLIVEIENAFSVSFTIPEMQQCSSVGELIFIVEKKLEERGNKNAE